MMKRGSVIVWRYSAVPSVEPLSQITISRVASLVRRRTFSTHWRSRCTRLCVRTTIATPSSAVVTGSSMADEGVSGLGGTPHAGGEQEADEDAGHGETDGDARERAARKRELERDEDRGGQRPAPGRHAGLVAGEQRLRERGGG